MLSSIDIPSLSDLIKSNQDQFGPLAAQVESQSNALHEAAKSLADSFSGSWFGWHSEMYFGDFQKPPLGSTFSVEWGAYHGLPPGWQARSRQEVQTVLETQCCVSVTQLVADGKTLGQAMITVRNGFGGDIAILNAADGFASEKALLAKIEELAWDEANYNSYVRAMQNAAPTMSRDSDAVMQGYKIPPHIHFAAIAFSVLAKARNALEFWSLSSRLIRQLGVQLRVRASQPDKLDLLLTVCDRFHAFAKQMRQRQRGRPEFVVNDEYDVQDLLHAILRLHFLDVRPEEWTPSVAGRSPRMDFLLKNERIVVEAKMTRDTLKDGEIGDELTQDIARYKAHPDCSVLICLVYDPNGLLKNPRGLEADLEKMASDALTVKVVVSPRV